jgi:hypothetical protein
MPSMHVAIAVLLAIFGGGTGARIGYTAFAILIFPARCISASTTPSMHVAAAMVVAICGCGRSPGEALATLRRRLPEARRQAAPSQISPTTIATAKITAAPVAATPR